MKRVQLLAVSLSAFNLFCRNILNRSITWMLVGRGAELEKTSIMKIGIVSGSSPASCC